MYTKDNIFAKHRRINSFQLSKLHTFEVAAGIIPFLWLRMNSHSHRVRYRIE